MPLFKTIYCNFNTQILVWQITESFEQLKNEVQLNETHTLRLNSMKSETHQRGFLSVRKLLHHAGYTDFDLYYDETGKPHLNGAKYISITHSHEFSAIIISDVTVGIDIELQRPKIIAIANKFCDSEFQFLNPEKKEDYIRKLTVIWGAKEAVFKIRNQKGISFKEHINVASFDLNVRQSDCKLHFDNSVKDYRIYFEEIEASDNEPSKQNFTLVYAFEKKEPVFKIQLPLDKQHPLHGV